MRDAYQRGLDVLSGVVSRTVIGADEAEFISQEMKKPLIAFGLLAALVAGYAIYSELSE